MEGTISSACNFCGRGFTSMTELAKHLSEHYDSLHKKGDVEEDEIHFEDDPVKKEINYALNNSFGFGSTNSSLVLKRV